MRATGFRDDMEFWNIIATFLQRVALKTLLGRDTRSTVSRSTCPPAMRPLGGKSTIKP
jgi:hypothetical protein